MDSRQRGRVAIAVFVAAFAAPSWAQWMPATTTTTSTTTTTTQEVFTNQINRNADAASVTVAQAATRDIESTRKIFADGTAVEQALLSTGLFSTVTMMSRTENVIVEQNTSGCMTSSNRLFFYAQPEKRFKSLDPFLIEAQILNTRPVDSRCTTNIMTVNMKGPFKTYQKVRTPGSGRQDAKLRNFFEAAYSHDSASASLRFTIANEGYVRFLRRLQLGGLLAQDAAISNSVVLTAITPKLESALVKINEGGLK